MAIHTGYRVRYSKCEYCGGELARENNRGEMECKGCGAPSVTLDDVNPFGTLTGLDSFERRAAIREQLRRSMAMTEGTKDYLLADLERRIERMTE